jgi:hypothetical protein
LIALIINAHPLDVAEPIELGWSATDGIARKTS